MTALTVKRTAAIADWDDGYIKLVIQTVLKPKHREATAPEIAMFAEQVQRTKLDPFMRQIYGIYRKDDGVEKMTIQVGIDGFRLIAERTGKYEGQTPVEWCDSEGNWTDVWLKPGNPSAARVGVRKTGHPEPTFCVAHWTEYLPSSAGPMWRKMPANQLGKCAEALALRKVFPNELSGLYTPEEMEQADLVSTEADVVSTVAAEAPDVDRSALMEMYRFAVTEGVPENTVKKLLVAHGVTDTSDVDAGVLALHPSAIDAFVADLKTEAGNVINAREEKAA